MIWKIMKKKKKNKQKEHRRPRAGETGNIY